MRIYEEVCLCGQHFKVHFKWVADSLSRDHHVPDDVLAHILWLFLYWTDAEGLSHLSSAIRFVSWFCRMIRLSSKPAQDPKGPMSSTIGAGLVRKAFLQASSLGTIHSWMQSQPGYDLLSLSYFLKHSGTVSLQEEIRQVWKQAQLETPWTKWKRSSVPTTISTHSSQDKIN